MSVRYLYRRSRRHHDRTARLASPSCPRLVQTAMWRFRLRLPNAEHEAHPWVLAQVAPDFKLLDVWGLPAEGGPDEFGSFLEGQSRALVVALSLGSLVWVGRCGRKASYPRLHREDLERSPAGRSAR